jgi:hypothetical protein
MLAAAVALAISSCGGSTSSSSSSNGGTTGHGAPPPVGKSIRMHAGDTTLVVTARRVVFPLRGSGMLLLHGDTAAGVEMSVRNAGHSVYDSSSESDVGLLTDSGQPAEPGFAARGACTTFEIDFLKEVEPGESRSGCVAFDVPKGTKPAEVRFSPEGREALGRSWTVQR